MYTFSRIIVQTTNKLLHYKCIEYNVEYNLLVSWFAQQIALFNFILNNILTHGPCNNELRIRNVTTLFQRLGVAKVDLRKTK